MHVRYRRAVRMNPASNWWSTGNLTGYALFALDAKDVVELIARLRAWIAKGEK